MAAVWPQTQHSPGRAPAPAAPSRPVPPPRALRPVSDAKWLLGAPNAALTRGPASLAWARFLEVGERSFVRRSALFGILILNISHINNSGN